MPKARDQNRDRAFEIFKKNKGDIDLVEIASQLNVSPGTVRGWKSKDKWEEKMNGAFRKNTERSERNIADKKSVVSEEVNQMIENPDLTDKQRLFCIYYVKYFNATKAYQKAYECSYGTAMVEGCKTLRNPKIKNEIQRLKQNRLNKEMLAPEDIFQKYMDIAFADITDYVEFGREKVQVMGAFGPVYEKDEVTGEKIPVTKTINVIRFKESNMVDGTLISEVKQGRDGVSIRLLDKQKALQWLTDHMDMATEEQKARIEALKARTKSGDQTSVEDKVQKLFNAIGGALDVGSE